MKKNISTIKQLLLASCSFIFSSAAFAQVDVITDGGFELGPGGGSWTEASTNFGTPICDVGSCGLGGGTGPHAGTFWSWFGGIAAVLEESSMTQTVTLAAGSTANLNFYLEQANCDDPADFMDVIIDGTDTIFHTDGTSALCGVVGYSLQTINMDVYCDGGSHTLQFHSITMAPNGNVTNFFVDDVSLIVTTGGGAACTDTVSFAPGIAIPDNDPVGVIDSQAVAGMPGTTLGVDVRLLKACFNITHTWVGDLIVTLTSPAGASVVLMDRPGFPALPAGCDGDDVDACVILGTGNEMENVCNNLPAISGDYTAAGGADLDAINTGGGSPNGTWKITVSDNAGLDLGTLNSWQLIYDSGPSPSWSPSPDSLCATSTSVNLNSLITGTAGGTWSGSGVTDSTFNPAGLSGNVTVTYSVTVGSCSSTESHDFYVEATTPACSFTAAVTNTTVTITNATTGAVSYSWDFGDGSPLDNTTNPVHNYATNGTYTITLSATNVCGTTTCTQSVTITGCPDVIVDGGFEAGPGGGAWTEASTNFGTPICDVASCGVGGGTGPHNGSTYWTWFGGIPATLEEGSMTQSVTLPTGSSANLYFYLEQPNCDDPGDFMDIVIDGTDTIFHTDGGSALCGVVGYVLQTVNMDVYCDGGAHSLQFHSITMAPNGNVTNIFVDDVSLLTCPVGINEQTIAQEISILPNPANQYVNISMKGINADKISINIFNALGQSVFGTSVEKVAGDYSKQVNVSKWNKGVYVLQLQAGDKSVTKNIVIQ